MKKKNKSIFLNVLYVLYNTEKIRHTYKSKYGKNRFKVIFLMITDAKKLHYLAVKSLSALLRGVTSNHKENFCCLICFYSYATKIDSKSMRMYSKIMIIVM